MAISKELIDILMEYGLTHQQATNKTAETCAKAFMDADSQILVKEANNQVEIMKKIVDDLRNDYRKLSDAILSIQKAQTEYGAITENKAKNTLALYASILALNEKMHVNPDKSAESAGYILYAYLGGQAKREYGSPLSINEKNSNSLGTI